MVHYKDTVISGKVQNFFQENVKEALKELNNYIVDIFVAPDKVRGGYLCEGKGKWWCGL